jgi:hypothetical protein
MKKFLLPAVFFALATASLQAQTAAPAATPLPGTKIALWICNSPGGTYEVALHTIVSVSTCEYIVDGIARVSEVNIDTNGNMAVRFYYIEPLTPNSPLGLGQATIDKAKEIAQEAADRTGQDAWKKVVKNYPTTTHAHTIEYRVDTKDDLMLLFTSAEKAFRTNTAATLTVGDTASELTPNAAPSNPASGN